MRRPVWRNADAQVEHVVDYTFDKLEESFFRKEGVTIPREPKREL
jgi:hypothetical protein